MLSPPSGLRPDLLADALARHWQLTATSMRYLPLGFGSHHWEISGPAGARWFATVDDLPAKRWTRAEPLDSVHHRLRASLASAAELANAGLDFVVAPVPTATGEPLARLASEFSLALYPFVAGQSFEWGPFPTEEHRLAVLDLLIAIHTAPAAVSRHALADDLEIQFRDELADSLRRDGPASDDGFAAEDGPFARPTADLIATYAGSIQRQLDRYDALAAEVSAGSAATVLTHGEPHRANTMRTSDGWLLIDWDTVLLAPAERDLCDLDPGDGSILAAYQQATGVRPRQSALELYKLRWDLTDIAIAAAQFRAPHPGDANDAEAFELLGKLLAQIAGPSSHRWPGTS